MSKEHLYDWIFHYNHYTEKWSACKRDFISELFSNRTSKNILSSSKIETLIELVSKTGGNHAAIDKLLKIKEKGNIKHVIVY